MRCKHCKTELKGNLVKCPSCSMNINDNRHIDNGDTGYSILGLCFPIIGLILYFMWKNTQPNNARAVGKGALLAVILWFIFRFILFLVAPMTS